MPRRPKSICSYPGCGQLVDKPGRCDRHPKRTRKHSDERRGTAAQRGYGRTWQKARAVYLQEHPLCVECQREGRVTPATVVDHIVPHRGNQELFWDVEGNWQSLCAAHHNAKTARGQ